MRAWSTLVVLLIAGVVSAQTPAGPALEGRVLDEAGRPVVGARVTAGGAAARTDEDGRFRLERPPDDATLVVEADGFLPARVPVRALGQAAAEVRLQTRKRFEETVDVVAAPE